MKVTTFGTRGSVPISGPEFVKTGGNTTCLRVESPCLPDGLVLAVDAGSGFIPFSKEVVKTPNLSVVHILQTHWHHDHTQGFPLSPLGFMKNVKIVWWGPEESGYSPREVIESIIKPPFFPVPFEDLGSHFEFRKLTHPDSKIIAFHPVGGVQMCTTEDFERADGMIDFGAKGKYSKKECLVVRMHWTNHPERTITFRFEEGPSGKVFVFLTDHENQERISNRMRKHLQGAHVLIMDGQYSRERYDAPNGRSVAGFGHGTPDFCVRTALEVGAERLGITHHDPNSTDDDVEMMHREALAAFEELKGSYPTTPLTAGNIFMCRDYEVLELFNVAAY